MPAPAPSRRPARRGPLAASAAVLVAAFLAATGVAAAGGSTTVEMLASSYSPATFSVAAGTTIVFQNTSTFPHTATADDGSFDTGMINPGGSKSVVLSSAGSIAFHCQFHGAVGGVGQSGMITVQAVAGATSAPAGGGTGGGVTPPSSASITDLPGGIAGLPLVAFGLATLGAVALALVLDAIRGARTRG